MYSISNEYKTACKALTRQSRTKIIVDNVTYDGAQFIKDYPKFSHSNEKMIGGFPIKSAEFSLWTKNDLVDLVDKPIKIYRGLVINNSVEWVPQGLFYAQEEDIKTSDTGEYITVKCYDGAKDLGTKKYIDNNTYPISETNYIKDVINQSGYELDEEVFVESNYMMKQKPNMVENTSIREIVSRYAEQRGAIAVFSRLGKIQIKRPTKIDFTYKFYEYKKMTCESIYGSINQIIIGNRNRTNNCVYPDEKQNWPWVINDNPFLDLLKQERLEEIYSQVTGLKLVPFELTSALDVFFLDLNDVISVQKKDKTFQELTILSIETENRLKCKLSASVQSKSSIDYKLAGSIKEDLASVKLDVDYNKKEINALATKANETESKVADLQITAEEISQKVDGTYDFVREVSGSNKLTIENAKNGILQELHVTGKMELLYPSDDLYLSDDLYPIDSYLNVESEKGAIKQVHLPINYLHTYEKKVVNEETNETTTELISDEFVIEQVYNDSLKRNESKAKIIRRVGTNTTSDIKLGDDLSNRNLILNFPNPLGTNANFYLGLFSSENYRVRELYQNGTNVIELFDIKNSKVVDTLYSDAGINLSSYQLPADFGVVTYVIDSSSPFAQAFQYIKKYDLSFYELSQEKVENLGLVEVELFEGINKIYLESFKSMNYKAKYVIKNDFTDHVVTQSQFSAGINIVENSIKQEVDAEIEGVNNDIKEINGSLELKIDKENLCSELSGQADDINFEGDRFSWKSKGSSMTRDGHFKTKDADIGGFQVNETQMICLIKPDYDYSQSDKTRLQNILEGSIVATAEDMKKYDFNRDNKLNSYDLLYIQQFLLTGISKSNPGKFILDTADWKTPLKILNGSGEVVASFGAWGTSFLGK